MNLKRNPNEKEFSIVTIAGYRYDVTMLEVFGWFANKRFYFFVASAVLLLIFLAPHNATYKLEYFDRFVFWPLMTITYIAIYICSIWLGSLYAKKYRNRSYYSPSGMLIATFLTTYSGSYFVSILTGNPPDLSIYKAMEVLFNMLLACLVEGIHFAYNVPIIRDRKKKPLHSWEEPQ